MASLEFFYPEIIKHINATAGEQLIVHHKKPSDARNPDGSLCLSEDIDVRGADFNKLAKLIGVEPLKVQTAKPHWRAPGNGQSGGQGVA